MKKSILLTTVFAGIMALLCTGCHVTEVNKSGEPVSIFMPVRVKPNIETKNVLIEGSAAAHSILGIISWGPTSQAVGVDYGTGVQRSANVIAELLKFTSKSEIIVRNAAAYNATTAAKADIILAPRYVLTTDDYIVYKRISCKVVGYPGYIKGVKVVDCPEVCKDIKAASLRKAGKK